MRPIDGVHNGDLRLSGDLTLAGATTRDQDSLAVKTFIAIREARYLVNDGFTIQPELIAL